MSTFVCEYSWMWTDLHLSLAECRVYAYIHGLSQSATRGYDGYLCECCHDDLFG